MAVETPTGAMRLLLLALAAFNVASSCALGLGFKLPVLSVYYNVPYYVYQDLHMAVAHLGQAAMFWTAANHLAAVPAAIFTISSTALGLAFINVSEPLADVLQDTRHRHTYWYWAHTATLGAVAIILGALYVSRPKSKGRLDW